MTDIYIGTAGYSYEDWEGPFYPEGVKTGGQKIQHYLNFFNTVEIDSSFYKILSPGYFWFLIKNTSKEFLINLKMHQEITHFRGESFKKTKNDFFKSIDPLLKTERQFLVLFQFPYAFKYNLENLEYLRKITLEFDIPKVIEFRHESWNKKEVYQQLQSQNFILSLVDTPNLKGLFPSNVNEVTADSGYIRFHGRNAAKWWKPEKAYERYNYEYTNEEINKEIKKRILQLVKKTRRLVVIFNNHYQAKAVRNAIKLIEALKS